MTEDNAYAMHKAGVHTQCKSDCRLAGTIDRFHSHDFDGPLWNACGCGEDE